MQTSKYFNTFSNPMISTATGMPVGRFTKCTFKNPIKKDGSYTTYAKIVMLVKGGLSTRKEILDALFENRTITKGYYSCMFSDMLAMNVLVSTKGKYSLGVSGKEIYNVL